MQCAGEKNKIVAPRFNMAQACNNIKGKSGNTRGEPDEVFLLIQEA